MKVLYRRCPDRLVGTTGRFDVAGCRDCGLVRTDPRPDPAAMEPLYPREYLAFEDDRPVSAARRLARRIVDSPYHLRYGRSILPEPRTGADQLLELGCGVGIELARLQAEGWAVWGVEPSGHALEQAIRRTGLGPQRLLARRAEEATFPSGSFDVVLMSHVIEHLHDPAAVVGAIRTWMRPGARLIIRCPNFGSWERRLFGRFWIGLDPPRHLVHFTEPTLRALLGSAGLRVVSLRPQLEYSSPAMSAAVALAALARRPARPRASGPLYGASLPFVALLRASGSAGMMEVIAERA